MATTSGTGGSWTFANIAFEISSWTLDYSQDSGETTDFADVGVESSIGGVKRWTATVTGNWDIQNTAILGAEGDLSLFMVSGGTDRWIGNARLESFGAASDVQAVNSMTYNFKGNGALTVPS